MITSRHPQPLTPTERKLVALADELATSLSFNGTLAQIYAVLFIRPDPLSLGEISTLLGMSKGNTSVNIRMLESWGAVRKAWVQGSRRDHYEPIRDLKAIALRRIQEGFSRRLAMAKERLDDIHMDIKPNGKRPSEGPDELFLKNTLTGLQREIASVDKFLKHLQDLYRLKKMLG